jgi:hypothetical protein
MELELVEAGGSARAIILAGSMRRGKRRINRFM